MEQSDIRSIDSTQSASASFDFKQLFSSENLPSFSDLAKKALPSVFDNGFELTGVGLDCKKGSTLKFDDNMPVLKYDSASGPQDNMPVRHVDGATGDNMPVLTAEDTFYSSLNGCGTTDGLYASALGGNGSAESTLGGASSGSGNSSGLEGYTTTPGSADAVKGPETTEPARPAETTELKLPNEGAAITDLDAKINPRLGCALAVSTALHELDKDFPVTNNNKELAKQLLLHGYDAKLQEDGLKTDQMQPGDVIVGQRQTGMPGHAAIYKGNGKTYENDSDSGRITGDGDPNYFNHKMHDEKGNWNKNGFESVYVFRKLTPEQQAQRKAEIASHY